MRGHGAGRTLTWLLVALAIAVVAVMADRFWRGRDVELITVTAGTPGIGLEARTVGDDLQLSWSKEAPVIREAHAGVLSLHGSGPGSYIHLAREQLRRGAFRVTAAGSDLRFVRLHVIGESREAMESIPLAGAPMAGLPPFDYSRSAAGAGAPLGLAGAKPTARAPLRRPAPAPVDSTPERAGAAERPAAPEAVAARAAEPPKSRETSGPAGSAEPDGPLVEARPVHRIVPAVPPHLREMVKNEIRVPVRIYIDESGNVVRTAALSGGSSLAHRLSVTAIEAARQWRFEPAHRGTRRVPSETVVEFVFGTP